jgi:hypothetical protein
VPVIHLFLKMAQKVDEAANFFSVQLIEQASGIYDKRHPDYARRDKINMACEKFSHEMESGIRVYIYTYKTYNRIRIHNVC